MLGISYGELFLIIGATTALVGPKDLPRIARIAGRLAGRAIGYVQLARGQFENVMQHSQARQVHKELQDTLAQLEAIRYEIRSISVMNPGPLTRRLVDNLDSLPKSTASNCDRENREEEKKQENVLKGNSCKASTNLHSQATAYARLAESAALESASLNGSSETDNHNDEAGRIIVLPLSAESAGLLPDKKGSAKGSDVLLEAVLEAEVARSAKDFFSQPENQIHDA